MRPRDFQAAEVPLMLAGHRALWWRPGVGKTLPLALAGGAAGGPQLWNTLADLRPQAARVIAAVRPGARIQTLTTTRDRLDPQADVVITSYDLMRVEAIWRQLAGRRWASCVADEAHALKETSATRTRAFYGFTPASPGALFRSADRVWIATGTPIINNAMDAYPHVSRLRPDLAEGLLTKQAWEDAFCTVTVTPFGKKITGSRDHARLRAILTQMGSFRDLDLTVRLDVDELPLEATPAELAKVREAATPEQWAEIDALLADMEGGDRRAEAQLDARLLPMASALRVLGTIKAPILARVVADELRGGLRQVVVFGFHIDALNRMHDGLNQFGAAVLNGQTPRVNRDSIVQSFMRGDIRVLLASRDVAGTGLDGLQVAQRVIIAEPYWSPKRNEQLIRRLFRTGQQHPVHASFASVARSPDERIAQVLARRARDIHSIEGEVWE